MIAVRLILYEFQIFNKDMEYYNHLDAQEKDLLENYTARLNYSSNKGFFTPMTSSRTVTNQRLPNLNSFSSILYKPSTEELVPRPEINLKPQKRIIRSKKSQRKVKMNGKFYTEQGLNVNHPEIQREIKLIFNLIESHKEKSHKDLLMEDFSELRKHYF
jgi:hypothetical protein